MESLQSERILFEYRESDLPLLLHVMQFAFSQALLTIDTTKPGDEWRAELRSKIMEPFENARREIAAGESDLIVDLRQIDVIERMIDSAIDNPILTMKRP